MTRAQKIEESLREVLSFIHRAEGARHMAVLERARAALSLPADEPSPKNWLDKRWESPEFRAAYGKASGEMAKWDEGYRAGVEAAAKEVERTHRDVVTVGIAARIRANCLAPPSDSRDQGERLAPCLCCDGPTDVPLAALPSNHHAVCRWCRAPSPSADPEVTR